MNYPININKLELTKTSENLTWNQVKDELEIPYWNLRRIRDLGQTEDFEEFTTINEWMKNPELFRRRKTVRLNKLAVEQMEKEERLREEEEIKNKLLQELKEQEEQERVKELERQEKLREQREANRHFRIEKELDKLDEIEKKEVFRNIKYITKIDPKVENRKFKKGTFVRVPKGLNLEDVGDFFYRYKRVLEVSSNTIHVEKETYIRNVELSTLNMFILQKYYNDEVIEVFKKVE